MVIYTQKFNRHSFYTEFPYFSQHSLTFKNNSQGRLKCHSLNLEKLTVMEFSVLKYIVYVALDFSYFRR